MSKIPFPNPHDADSLNTYLDALAAGKQAAPESDVETAAQEFHQLASQAEVQIPTQPIEPERGVMQTATLAAPISNRTRRQMEKAQKPSRSYGWLSAVIVAGLLVSMIGSAWLNRETGNPHDQLAWAPGTPEAVEVLTPESAPWIADFDSIDCRLPSRMSQVDINPNAVPGPEPERFAIVGAADSETSATVVEEFREMRSCRILSFAWSYWTERRMNEVPRNLDEQSRTELADLEDHFSELYPQQFMAVATDIEIDVLARQEWQAQQELGLQPIPMPLGAKLNPEWGVELSDGRVAFPATVLYSASDPVIARHGLPLNYAPDPVVMIFAFEDGDWKYDDSLLLCLADCDIGVGSPVVANSQDWLIAAHPENCTVEPLTSEELRDRTSTMPAYEDREYSVTGTPEAQDAVTSVERVREMTDCSLGGQDMAMLGNFTDLGIVTLSPEVSPAITRGEVALALRHQEHGAREIANNKLDWPATVILDGEKPAQYLPDGRTWEPVSFGDSENSPTTRRSDAAFRPESTALLEDGRVAVAPVWLIELDDRGAVRYEGDIWQQAAFTSIVREEGGEWLVDEIIAVTPSSIWAWYWEEQYDPEPTLLSSPIVYETCPVTLPNHVNAPNGLDHYAADGHTWFEDGIWISIPTDGVMKIQPHQQNTRPESEYFGWAFEKLFVLRGEDVSGMVEISGQRLDEPSDLMPLNEDRVDANYGLTGFVPVSLMIPGEGCWEFTATAGDASATWVLVVEYVDDYEWTQPITYEECPQDEVLPLYDRENPTGEQYTQEDYDQVSSERSYDVVGPADPDDAQAVAKQMRQAQACTERSQALPIFTARNEYESRTTAGRNSLESLGEQRTDGADGIAAWYEDELGLTPEGMWVYVNPEEIDQEVPASQQTRHMINPDHALLLADGRIVTIPSIVTYMPITHDILPHYAVYATIWANVDGEWLTDERLPICLGDCTELEGSHGVGGDMIASPTPATPWPVEECPYCRPPGS